MSKFMKICAIAALVLIGVGLAIGITAGAIQGPKSISDIVETVTKGKVHVNLFDWDDWGISVNDKDLIKSETKYKYEVADITGTDNMDFDKDYPILSGDVQEDFAGTEVESLDIEVGACEMEFKTSTDSDFHLEAKKVGKMQCFTENGMLKIKAIRRTKIGNDHCVITLYVPENFRFAAADIELGAGTLSINDLNAGKADIEVGAGHITCSGLLQADKLDLEIGAGGTVLEQADIGKLNAQVGAGGLEMRGIIREKAKLECSMGGMKLKLDDSEKDYNYTINSAMGDVEIGSYSAKGLASDKRIDNGADKDITVECSMGGVDISFKE